METCLEYVNKDYYYYYHYIYSLKRTNSVLQEHEEALRRKKEMLLAKAQQSRQELNKTLVPQHLPYLVPDCNIRLVNWWKVGEEG